MKRDNNFENFAHEAQQYFDHLAGDLEHPQEKVRVIKVWKAVLHSIRDRIHFGEAFQFMQPLPTILKGMYAENWEYLEQPKYDYKTLEEMKTQVKQLQNELDEDEFPWKKSTEEIIAITLLSLRNYLPENKLSKIKNQLPKEIQQYL